eukprot:15463500-Alexandrium_andersonii.AAC.1
MFHLTHGGLRIEGLRRIAALASLGRIADCTLGILRCKDPSRRASAARSATVRARRLAGGQGLPR